MVFKRLYLERNIFLKINFILSEWTQRPVGGYKLIYQYANYFVQQGHDVAIYYNLYPSKRRVPRPIGSIKRKVDFYKQNKKIRWFHIDSRVKLIVGVYKGSQIRKSDVVIATAVTTAQFVNELPKSAGRKFYFIQNHEVGNMKYTEKMVNATYKFHMTNIVISSWLADIVERVAGKRPIIISDFILATDFYLPQVSKTRENTVSLLNHGDPTKRTTFGLETLKEVKKLVPDLKVLLFGTYEKPTILPDWIEFYYRPSIDRLRDDIYGRSKIYLMPSVQEGWGLTGMEAMASGAVPIASKYGGMLDYMTNQIDSLLVTKDNQTAFISALVTLLNDDEQCSRMAAEATKITKKFSLNQSAAKFLKVLYEH